MKIKFIIGTGKSQITRTIQAKTIEQANAVARQAEKEFGVPTGYIKVIPMEDTLESLVAEGKAILAKMCEGHDDYLTREIKRTGILD